MNMPNLEPDVFFCQRSRWHGNNISKTLEKVSISVVGCPSFVVGYLKTLLVLLLLFVDYAETKVNLVGLLKIRLHPHDLRKGLFRMLQRPITIIQDSDTVPKLWFLIIRVLSS